MLASSDASWVTCRRDLRAAPGSAVLPESTWVPGTQYLDNANATRLVAGLLGLHAMAPLPALEVVAVATAPPAIASQGADVLAPTTAVDLDVVVANDGNVDEHDVEVGAAATLQSSPASPVPVQRTVDIDAGRSSTVSLPALAVQPGASYTVQLTAEALRGGGPGPIATVTRRFAVETAATTTAVGSSLSAIAAGQSVRLSAYVTSSLPGIGSPTGAVAFQDDGASIAPCAAVPVRSSRAVCTTTLGGGGLHALVATYGGDAHHAGSTSPGISVSVSGG